MKMTAKNTYVVNQVLRHVMSAYPEKSESIEASRASLICALQSLWPLEPHDDDIAALHGELIRLQASDIACKSAWALYKDLIVNKERLKKSA